jgi:uncharacterized protein (DUF58 family)
MASPQRPELDTDRLELDALALTTRLPALLVEASRVALTVAQGVHGRRRVGPGETFWQFRNFDVGDPSVLIDWRRSANSSHLYVREREWEAAHTVWLWPDLSSSMNFRSHLAPQTKAERAVVLALALGGLMAQAGERTALANVMTPTSSRRAIQKLAENLARSHERFETMPDNLRLPRHSEIVLFSDFLDDIADIQQRIGIIANQGVRGHLVHLMDPAEETLPYSGRVRFTATEGGQIYTAERAETLRRAYVERVEMHKQALAQSARKLGWSYFIHHTDRPPAEILLTVNTYLSGLDKGYRAGGATPSAATRSNKGGTSLQ